MTKTKDTGHKHSLNKLSDKKHQYRPAGLLPHVKVRLVPIISSR